MPLSSQPPVLKAPDTGASFAASVQNSFGNFSNTEAEPSKRIQEDDGNTDEQKESKKFKVGPYSDAEYAARIRNHGIIRRGPGMYSATAPRDQVVSEPLRMPHSETSDQEQLWEEINPDGIPESYHFQANQVQMHPGGSTGLIASFGRWVKKRTGLGCSRV
ncbi:hypothetical protein K440DRAFT_638286 [Wilcoxina mikolae CBS 423.85]|nr:hypothetical protein K440DRAFT_638286 [Wilcoxina mikolae CBS 423.85]